MKKKKKKNKENVQKLMGVEYPEGLSACNIPLLDPKGSFWIVPPKNSKEVCHALHPLFLAARPPLVPHSYPPTVQTVTRKVCDLALSCPSQLTHTGR
jgi:hypothetical protein